MWKDVECAQSTVFNHQAGTLHWDGIWVFFFANHVGSKVQTWFKPEPNLPNPVLLVLVHGSALSLPTIRFRFTVQRNVSGNWTELNFSIPRSYTTPVSDYYYWLMLYYVRSESRRILKAMSKACGIQQRNDKTNKKNNTNGYPT
jgi:hypothetical protein